MNKQGMIFITAVIVFALVISACTPAQVDRALVLLEETKESMAETETMVDSTNDYDEINDDDKDNYDDIDDDMDDDDDMNDDDMDDQSYGVVYRDGKQYCLSEISGIVSEDIYVAKGETCTLNGAQIDGNIFVMADAVIYVYASRLEGNLEASYASRVEVHFNSYIAGNVMIANSNVALVNGSRIDGNLEIMYNSGDQILSNNYISGNLEASNDKGLITINDNTIDGNLICYDNSKMPTGGNNMVEGDMEGQCAGL